jgi:Protein of unknown function (DUF1203)
MTITVEPLHVSLAGTDARVSTDEGGGAPLRCCLRYSRPGELVALVSVTPPGPMGAYQETGPVFVHADGCPGPSSAGYPDAFRDRPQVFRAYNAHGSIVGGELVDAGTDQEAAAERLLADPAVAFLHTRNVVYGCYMLMIRRGDC